MNWLKNVSPECGPQLGCAQYHSFQHLQWYWCETRYKVNTEFLHSVSFSFTPVVVNIKLGHLTGSGFISNEPPPFVLCSYPPFLLLK